MTHAEVFAAVRRIPRGRVATYGQIAALAGYPGHARQVGYALSALDTDSPVPWHRVVNAAGRISPRRGDAGGAMLQQLRLEQEGVPLRGARVSLRDYGWRTDSPDGETTVARARPPRADQPASDARRGSISRPPGRA